MGGVTDAIGGAFGLNEPDATGNIRFRPPDVRSGLLGQFSFDPESGVDISPSSQLQSQIGALSQTGQGLISQGRQAATSDFSDLRDENLSLLRELSAEDEETAAASTASRLFNQGALASTRGQETFQDLIEAQENADLQRQLASIGLARNQQQLGMEQIGLGSGLFGQSAALAQAPMGLADIGNRIAQGQMQGARGRANIQDRTQRRRMEFATGMAQSVASAVPL